MKNNIIIIIMSISIIITVNTNVFCANIYSKAKLQEPWASEEVREIAKIFVYLSGVNDNNLSLEMYKLSVFNKIMLRAFAFGGSYDISGEYSDYKCVSNVYDSLDYEEEKNSVYTQRGEYSRRHMAFCDAISANFHINDSNPKLPRVKKQDVSEIRSVLLEVIRKHIEDGTYSKPMVSDMLILPVVFISGRIEKSELKNNYQLLSKYLSLCKDEDLRFLIYKCLNYTSINSKELNLKFTKDHNRWIAQHALDTLVCYNGVKECFPEYIRLTWELFGNGYNNVDVHKIPDLSLNPNRLLEFIIQGVNEVSTEKEQLEWINKNLDALQWDAAERNYIFKAN